MKIPLLPPSLLPRNIILLILHGLLQTEPVKAAKVIYSTGYGLRQLTTILLSVPIQLSLSLALIYVPVSAELQPRYALNKNVFK